MEGEGSKPGKKVMKRRTKNKPKVEEPPADIEGENGSFPRK